MPHASLTISPRPELVRIARMMSVSLARRSGLPEPLLDEVRLAVGEAVSRAVLINVARVGSQPVHLEFTEDDRGYEVAVTDAGDAESVPDYDEAPDYDQAPDHEATTGAALAEGETTSADGQVEQMPPGLDLALVAGMADEMTVASNPAGGTVVRLRWTR